MSRLIKVFVKPVLFKKAGDSGPGCIPILKDVSSSLVVGELPEGGGYCQFITAYQYLKDFQDNKFSIVGWIPGNGLRECYEVFGIDRKSKKPWIKVLYQESIGWITLEHVEKIYEINFDQNGDTVEVLAYPYPSDD